MGKEEARSLFCAFRNLSVKGDYHVIEARTSSQAEFKLKTLLSYFIRRCENHNGVSFDEMDRVITAFVRSDNVLYCFSEAAKFDALYMRIRSRRGFISFSCGW